MQVVQSKVQPVTAFVLKVTEMGRLPLNVPVTSLPFCRCLNLDRPEEMSVCYLLLLPERKSAGLTDPGHAAQWHVRLHVCFCRWDYEASSLT